MISVDPDFGVARKGILDALEYFKSTLQSIAVNTPEIDLQSNMITSELNYCKFNWNQTLFIIEISKFNQTKTCTTSSKTRLTNSDVVRLTVYLTLDDKHEKTNQPQLSDPNSNNLLAFVSPYVIMYQLFIQLVSSFNISNGLVCFHQDYGNCFYTFTFTFIFTFRFRFRFTFVCALIFTFRCTCKC